MKQRERGHERSTMHTAPRRDPASRREPRTSRGLAVQRRVEPVPLGPVQRVPRGDGATTAHVQGRPVENWIDLALGLDRRQVAVTASAGVSGSGVALPHADRIQASFGPAHDIGGIRAHIGGAARAASERIGAEAYATGDHVAFRGPPDLHTAAHEAAHVVQQRSGVRIEGGVGSVGDAYERHADEVAAAVVRGDSAAPLLSRHAGGGGAAAPVVQRTSLAIPGKANETYHVRYREQKAQRGFVYTVFVPSGFDPSLKVDILDRLGVGEEQVYFVNEAHDDVDMTVNQTDEQGRPVSIRATVRLSNQAKVRRAKELVVQYLHARGIDELEEGKVEALIRDQAVEFYEPEPWEKFNHGTPGMGSPKATEGLTHPGAIGHRALGINAENHTLGAIVHELFHSLEHPSLQDLYGGLVEAMTEYITLQATGLTVRSAMDDGGLIYQDNVRLLKLALAKGAVTSDAILRAYFLGDLSGIKRLIAGWKQYIQLNDKVSFIYTGNIPTPQQIAAMWEQLEKFLS